MQICARRQAVAALVALLSLAALAAQAPQREPTLPPHAWPTFGGTPARNMVNPRDKSVPTEWAVEGGKLQNVKWVADLGSKTYGGVVISGGKVFVGTNKVSPRESKGAIKCFRQSDGKLLWEVAHAPPPEEISQEAFKDNSCAAPTVEENRLYYVTPACVVICADVETGKAVWQLDLMKDFKVVPYYVANCTPLVVGDLVYVVTGNGIGAESRKVVSPKAPSIVAIRKKDGKLAWQSALPGDRIIEGQWSNAAWAAVGGKPQVIFPGGDGYLYGLEPATGKMIWKFNCNWKGDIGPGLNKIPNYLVATPVVYGDKVYIGTGLYPGNPERNRLGRFWCVSLGKTGDVSHAEDSLDPAASANKASALVWQFGGLIQPPPKFGRNAVFGKTSSTAAVHDGLVYVAEELGYLHCLDAATGKQLWEHDLKTSVWSSPYWVDGKVYLATEDGDVAIFAHGRQAKLLGTVYMDGQIHTTPVVVDGVLYVATDTKLYAIGAK
jgi:outer membrane protein assembly factor BamB